MTSLSNAKMVVAIASVAVLSMNMALSEIVHVGAAGPLSTTPLPTTIERHLKASVNMTGNDEERNFDSVVSKIAELKPSWLNKEVKILSKKMGPNIDAFVAKCRKLNSNDKMVTFLRKEKHSDDAVVASFLFKYRDNEKIGKYCSPMLDRLFEQWKAEEETIKSIVPILLPDRMFDRVVEYPTINILKLYAEKLVPPGDNWRLYSKMVKALEYYTAYSFLYNKLKASSDTDELFNGLYLAMLKDWDVTPMKFSDTCSLRDYINDGNMLSHVWYDYACLYIHKGIVQSAGKTGLDIGDGDLTIYREQFLEHLKSAFRYRIPKKPLEITDENGLVKIMRGYWHKSGENVYNNGKAKYDGTAPEDMLEAFVLSSAGQVPLAGRVHFLPRIIKIQVTGSDTEAHPYLIIREIMSVRPELCRGL